MHTIVLATQKGGSGKSTLAIGLALAAKQAGFTVRLIETDPQGTLSNWLRRRNTDDVVVEPIYHAADYEPRLKMLADSGLQVAIVDTAAGLSAVTTAAIRHSDLCLIPSRPTVADIEATVSTLSVARAWKRPYSFVLNQTPIRGQRIDNAAVALAEEAALDLAEVLARPLIVMRNDHQDSLASGLAVSEFAPNGKSADEIRGLWRWIENRLELEATTNVLIDQVILAANGVLHVAAGLAADETTTLAS
ncbi:MULTISPECIES: ParA family protein [Bradyrhizobium]|uniref:ParA family protein n=1 Tax=Bradyrhizobium arachidis TaxID=858423 RepID=A0AAE7NGF5_9BRAD|nr:MULTISPECIES: ParA family protein [Bradyrhizobium]QOG16171.1 AAA family ATPase [Bradyrhizobium sp. SEMIA]QOZ65067.1 ParA family protein [Bradyrhizobium arachidis]UFW49582.1 ParA family protein [Bradyrhizobium arachidis]SFU31900.1 chromosome partitioning protein [Bradyrhizobium arachidis]